MKQQKSIHILISSLFVILFMFILFCLELIKPITFYYGIGVSLICISLILFILKVHHQLNKRHIWCLLYVIYIFIMIYLLFLSSAFARDPSAIMQGNYLDNLYYQYKEGTNLIPFETIHKMKLIFDLDYIDNNIAYINLLGNFIAFMPFSLFLPKIFPKMRKFIKFTSFMAIVIILVEIIQLFTLTGSMDIDDFILNFSGVLLAYVPIYLYYLVKKHK